MFYSTFQMLLGIYCTFSAYYLTQDVADCHVVTMKKTMELNCRRKFGQFFLLSKDISSRNLTTHHRSGCLLFTNGARSLCKYRHELSFAKNFLLFYKGSLT